MKIFAILILLSSTLVACQPNESESTPPPPGQINTNAEASTLTGLLQSSGLQPSEAAALGLPDSGFQLISQQAYFLVSEQNLSPYWGQCVSLQGELLNAPNSSDTGGVSYLYNRLIFRVTSVTPRVFSYCAYSDSSVQAANQPLNTFRGRLARRFRPAPDIAYDYVLTEVEGPRELEAARPEAPLNLFAENFEVLSSLENAVRTRQMVRLKAREERGYAEHIVLVVAEAQVRERPAN